MKSNKAPPLETPKEQKLSNLIERFVGYDTAQPGLYHYIDHHGELHAVTQLPPHNSHTHIRLVAISDTHERHELLHLPPGDVLLCLGDILMFNAGYSTETSTYKLHKFNQWLQTTPHQERILIGGNHDKILETLGKTNVSNILSNCKYICDEHLMLECGLYVFGTPVSIPNTSMSPNRAFQYTEAKVETIFQTIDENIDILMTHGTLSTLLAAQRFLKKNKTCSYYICGHVHEEHGVMKFDETTQCINASTMGNVNNTFQPINPPIVFDILKSSLNRNRRTESATECRSNL